MNTLWIVAGLGVTGVIVALITSWQRRDPKSDLGAVSNHWVAERRLGQSQDPQR